MRTRTADNLTIPLLQTGGVPNVGAIIFLILLFFSNPLSAQQKADLLIINSDFAIKKYALTQEVFLANQQKPSEVINLAEQTIDYVTEVVNRDQIKIIYCIGTKAYLLAHRLVPEKIIVFSSAINWLRLPEADQSYGVAQELPAAMQLTMYRYLFPQINKIGVLYSQQFNKEWLLSTQQAAVDVGIQIIGKEVSAQLNVSTATEQLLAEIDALWLISDPLVLTDKNSVVDLFRRAENRKIPVFAYSEIFVNLGAQLVISADIPTIGRQVSALVNSLRNETIVENRISHPAGSHVILNMRKLKRYSIKLNKEALGSVNQIIE